MKSLRCLLPCSVTALLVSCMTVSVSTDRAPGVDLTALRTYSWEHSEPSPHDPLATNPELSAFIRQAVDKTLAERGLARVSPEKADFRIRCSAAIGKRMAVQKVDDYYAEGENALWYHRRYGNGWRQTPHVLQAKPSEHEYTIREGTLIIDFVEKGSRKLLWRGIVKAEVQGDTPARIRETRIAKAIRDLFENYPD